MLSLLTHIQIPLSIFWDNWQNYSSLESFSIQHQLLPYGFYKLDFVWNALSSLRTCLLELLPTGLGQGVSCVEAWDAWEACCLLLVKLVLKLGQGLSCVEACEVQSSDLLQVQPIGIAGSHTLILILRISQLFSPTLTHKKESEDRGSSNFCRQWSYHRLPDDCHVTAPVTGFPHAWWYLSNIADTRLVV